MEEQLRDDPIGMCFWKWQMKALVEMRAVVALEWEKGRERRSLAEKGHMGTFRGYGDVLFLGEHDNSIGIYICQSSSNYTLKIVTIYCMKIEIK